MAEVDVKSRVRALLDDAGVEYDWLDHERVFTMEECAPIGERLGARHCKNLLLTTRNQSTHILLLTDDKPFKTAVFSKLMGVSRLSFVPGDMMPELLGVVPGSASPLALINDEQQRIKLAIDKSLLSWERIAVHPGDSTASVALRTADLLWLLTDVLHRDYTAVEL